MKKVFFLLLLACAFNAKAQLQKVNLQASGLTCAMCSKAIYKAVSAISFVDTVKVDIEGSTYEIFFKKNTTPQFDQIAGAVVDAGFSVAKFTAVVNFDKQAVDKNGFTSLDGIHYVIVANAPATLQGSKKLKLVGKEFMLPKDFKKMPPLKVAATDAKAYFVTIQ
jgi:copper chaperone CopZ